jgi:hypothetical protein
MPLKRRHRTIAALAFISLSAKSAEDEDWVVVAFGELLLLSSLGWSPAGESGSGVALAILLMLGDWYDMVGFGDGDLCCVIESLTLGILFVLYVLLQQSRVKQINREVSKLSLLQEFSALTKSTKQQATCCVTHTIKQFGFSPARLSLRFGGVQAC